MELSEVFTGNTLKASDLRGNKVPVTIADIEAREFDGIPKLVISFKNAKKTFVCNVTNARRIAKLYEENTDGWIGKTITLHTEMVDFKGDLVEAIRVFVTPEMLHQKPKQTTTTPPAMAPSYPPNDMDDTIPF
jgi:hypothetical protein